MYLHLYVLEHSFIHPLKPCLQIHTQQEGLRNARRRRVVSESQNPASDDDDWDQAGQDIDLQLSDDDDDVVSEEGADGSEGDDLHLMRPITKAGVAQRAVH